MPTINSCRGCGCDVIVHSTAVDAMGDITHVGNREAQDPDLCNGCEEKAVRELAAMAAILAKQE